MKNKNDEFKEDIAICTSFGEDVENYYGAISPPIFETSLFVFKSFQDIEKAFLAENMNYVYTRGLNPTVEILEKKIAALERGESCKCFSSGMAAISACFTTFTKQRDHILFINNVYGPTIKFAKYLKKYGVEYSMVLVNDENNERELFNEIENAIRKNTKIIYIESPGTFTFKLIDLEKVSYIAKKNKIITIIDNTWATPLFQKPLQFGIDISIHSCSKYISGHSDVLGGAVISRKEIIEKIFFEGFQLGGGVIGPFEAWLLIRGLRTLPLRMKQHQENALKIAEFLEQHKKIEKVNYPGLKSNNFYELGKKQLKGYSGLMSFHLKVNNIEQIIKFVNSLKIFKIGVSWGGYESLVLPAYHSNNIQELQEWGIPINLVRLSIGLEDVNLLIKDLENALASI
ncbi:cystathionine beta-lyases/cystathionine gamma-synthase [Thermoanaerobacter sp. YS13]|uniref:trans-sulfuration enzyme family protein n=1 Tax=Thermoanaerobacter sp. YS13 TaxID=1511746 RepID=UPI0005750548|nr:aminotransferase class I/II-fold pyridoxal phosphate-dependent enzyme [Thermoanaerobacter sp. YS13]KHO62704.1 cystathionine beta-lyases/cystathionine gamma-synthase [Thermoanaerobacter sp. YS13]